VPRLSNDSAELTPKTTFEGRELSFDFAGLEIGVAEYDEGPTGCTVLHFRDGPVACSTDVRGGSPAVSGAGVALVDDLLRGWLALRPRGRGRCRRRAARAA